jgi:hypothetical protein
MRAQIRTFSGVSPHMTAHFGLGEALEATKGTRMHAILVRNKTFIK